VRATPRQHGAAACRCGVLFSDPSASLQRDLNARRHTCSYRMTNKGGTVVPPRPTTTRGGPRGTSAPGGESVAGTGTVLVGEGRPRPVDRLWVGTKDCVAVVTTPDG
jgi:hypothetical protein